MTGRIVEAFLPADVAITQNNVYYNGPTISLPAGDWLLTGICHFDGFWGQWLGVVYVELRKKISSVGIGASSQGYDFRPSPPTLANLPKVSITEKVIGYLSNPGPTNVEVILRFQLVLVDGTVPTPGPVPGTNEPEVPEQPVLSVWCIANPAWVPPSNPNQPSSQPPTTGEFRSNNSTRITAVSISSSGRRVVVSTVVGAT